MNDNTITVEVGSHHTLIVDKLFGPTVFAELRIRADSERCEWVIERLSKGVWTEYAAIPAQLETDWDE